MTRGEGSSTGAVARRVPSDGDGTAAAETVFPRLHRLTTPVLLVLAVLFTSTGALFLRSHYARPHLALLFTTAQAAPLLACRRRPLPFTEGAVLLRWLADNGIGYFTASAARAPSVYRELGEVKRELGMVEPVRTGRDNPMVFFRLP